MTTPQGFRNPIVGGGGALVIPSIHSPGFQQGPPVVGWSINKNGTAYFGNVITSGTFSADSGNVGLTLGNAQLQAFYDVSGSHENWFIGQYTATTGGIVTAQSLMGLNANAGFFIGSAFNDTEGYIIVCPSGDTTGATDQANITNALAIVESVLLVPGTYYVNAPIVLPDQTGLVCLHPSWGIPTGNYGSGSGLPLQGAILKPVAGFSGSQVISMGSAGTSQHGGQRIYGITIDGTSLPAANTVNGIESQGYVGGVKMRDVVVWGHYNSVSTVGLGGHGLYAHNDGTLGHNPDFWQLDGCKFSACGGYGASMIALSDSWFVNCETSGNHTGGWDVENGQQARFIACRGNNNTTGGSVPGWHLVGITGFTGRVIFRGCDASANDVGVAMSGTGSGTWDMDMVADANTTQFSYAGTMNLLTPAAYNTSTVTPTFG